ncbi:TLC domain-containing protein 5-like [Elgaria multicarinata webbii]|uniref:TLC domain-containing protein 5-like n=1 Tax=Elgaria multicarinata webbii TaxID=159646 RepID=UPI002FCD680D
MVAIVFQVVCSFLVWLSLYHGFWFRNKHRSPEWSCRLVTLMHGLIATFLSGYIVLIDGPWPLTHTGYPNTTPQVCLMSLSLGYFIFDLCWCISFKSEDDLMLFHHMLSISGMVIVLALGESATEVNAVTFVSEITNPLLQMRWFLRDMGRYHGFVGDVVDSLFVVLFLGLRIIGGAWIMHSVVTSPRTIWMLKCGVLVMYMVSLGFLLDIYNFARRKVVKKYHIRRNEGTEGKNPKANGHPPAC